MIIGVPRERKTLEKRVAITPDGADQIVRRGHQVLIETGAGLGSSFSDDEYKAVGCKIVSTLKEVWNSCELLVKVKEPHESEFEFFRPGLALFDYLHLASLPEVTKALVEGGVTGIAYELVQKKDGRLPLLEPMSEVAGKLSVVNGATYLLQQNGGRGLLLGGTIGVPPANVLVIGAGIAGRNAVEVAVGFGADVTVMDLDYLKLDRVFAQYGARVKTQHATPAAISRAVKNADLLITAVLIPGAAAPKIITKEMIASMKKGSVFVDISIDQGGCGETIKPTNLDNPVFEHGGVIHYGVCNMPAQVPLTSTMALTAATLPYILRIADKGVESAIKGDEELNKAVNTYQGKLTNKAVADSLNMKYSPF